MPGCGEWGVFLTVLGSPYLAVSWRKVGEREQSMACGSNVPGPGPRDPACGMEGLPVVGGLGLLLSWMVTNSWTWLTVSWQ